MLVQGRNEAIPLIEYESPRFAAAEMGVLGTYRRLNMQVVRSIFELSCTSLVVSLSTNRYRQFVEESEGEQVLIGLCIYKYTTRVDVTGSGKARVDPTILDGKRWP